MKIGDLITMDTPLTPERYGVGIVQKVVQSRRLGGSRAWTSMVYHILWPDETISCQYDNEIVRIAEV